LLTCTRGAYGAWMSDEREAEAWDAGIEALERAEVMIPAHLARPRRSRPGRTIFGAAVSAVLVLLFSVLLGHQPR
jgi:hypothetical protein